LGVPFNNVRDTGSEQWHQERIKKDKPGSPCPKGFLKSNTEFTEQPICTASTQYQLLKLDQIAQSEMSVDEKEQKREKVLSKACLCDHLGNGALINLGILAEHRAPQAICPGPNIAYYDGKYSLREMVDHIYGRSESLASDERPHMFAKEITLYVDYVKELAEQLDDETGLKKLQKFQKNLEEGMEFCLQIANSKPYQDENLPSISFTVSKQKKRLQSILDRYEERISVKV